MGVKLYATVRASECVCVCVCSSQRGVPAAKPIRKGALSAWIGLETQFFIREFGVDNRNWLPTAETAILAV